MINLANLKAHPGAGVTLCAKNHYGSLIRAPPEKGYYDMHKNTFSHGTGEYRNPRGSDGPLPDRRQDHAVPPRRPLRRHPLRRAGAAEVPDRSPSTTTGRPACSPRRTRWRSTRWAWTSSRPRRRSSKYSRMGGTDDYLHEAALADNPPSGTFYDPDHKGNVARLASLGVHEHWNNAEGPAVFPKPGQRWGDRAYEDLSGSQARRRRAAGRESDAARRASSNSPRAPPPTPRATSSSRTSRTTGSASGPWTAS